MSENFKTFLFFGTLTGLLIVFGYGVGGVRGGILLLVLSMLVNLATYWFSDSIALNMAGANPVSPEQAPELYADLRDLSAKMGIPVPRLYISPNQQPNAFATGRNPETSAVCFNQGLLNYLTRDEIRGVMAHELAHIKNRDTLFATIAAVLAGTISSVANIALWTGMSDRRKDSNPIFEILAIIFVPIAASLIQFAISRSREYHADETGARITGQPQSLANALIKIEQAVKQIPAEVNPALSSLYIQAPFVGDLTSLFSTHPPTAERVRRLMAIQG